MPKLVRILNGETTDLNIPVAPSVLTSVNATRKLLCVHAERIWGGTEGRDYTICNLSKWDAEPTPYFARNRRTGETMHITYNREETA